MGKMGQDEGVKRARGGKKGKGWGLQFYKEWSIEKDKKMGWSRQASC